jgi:hypothetical protein
MNAVAIKKIMIVVAAAWLFVFVPGCHKEPDADKIKKVITSVQNASEEKDIKKIITSLSKSYRDPQGYDYDSIKGLLLGYFFQHQKVHVYIPDITINVEGAAAQAEFQAVLTGGQTGATNIVPEALGMYAFKVSFRKEDQEWKVISAIWNRVGEGGT